MLVRDAVYLCIDMSHGHEYSLCSDSGMALFYRAGILACIEEYLQCWRCTELSPLHRAVLTQVVQTLSDVLTKSDPPV